MNTSYQETQNQRGPQADPARNEEKKRETQFDNVLSLNSSELDSLEKIWLALREKLKPVCYEPAPDVTPSLASRLCPDNRAVEVEPVLAPLAEMIRQRNVRLGQLNTNLQKLLATIEL